MRKNLQHLKLKSISNTINSVESEFITEDGIKLKNNYNLKDLDNLNHIGFAAGFIPNLRGVNSMMYVKEPWNTTQNTSYYSAEKNNIFYKTQLIKESNKLFITLNSSSLYNSDSEGEFSIGNLKKPRVVIESVEDMKTLLNQIPLSKVNISIPMDGNFLPIFAFYTATAMEQGVDLKQLSGNFIKEITEDFTLSSNSIYPPKLLEKIIADITEYTDLNTPKFNNIHISGNQLQSLGASTDIELAFTLAYGLDCIREKLATGKKIDFIAPKISFSLTTGMNYFVQIAKMRAARMLWAKLLTRFNPTNSKSFAMNIHCETPINNLEEQNPFNNISRKCIEASASIFGGTQSLYINSTVGENSEQINKNTQDFLEKETKITKTIDPWAGSFLIENITDQITVKTWNLIEEIEQFGGMFKYIKFGNPLQKIEESLDKKHTNTESHFSDFKEFNKHIIEKENSVYSLEKDDDKLLNEQLERLELIKKYRDNSNVKQSLESIENCIKTGNGNILELTIAAAKCGATTKEINTVLC